MGLIIHCENIQVRTKIYFIILFLLKLSGTFILTINFKIVMKYLLAAATMIKQIFTYKQISSFDNWVTYQ